jgi:hypothetical protein
LVSILYMLPYWMVGLCLSSTSVMQIAMATQHQHTRRTRAHAQQKGEAKRAATRLRGVKRLEMMEREREGAYFQHP